MSDREVMQQALEALEHGLQSLVSGVTFDMTKSAITALRARLAEPQTCKPALQVEGAEAVAVVGTQADVWRGCNGQWTPPGPPMKTVYMLRDLPDGTSLYTAPPARSLTPAQEAAPELLEALKHAVEIAENKRPGTWDDLLPYRVLIAKAEGARHD